MLAAVIPFPTPERTPPVTNMYFCVFPWFFTLSMGFYCSTVFHKYAIGGVLYFWHYTTYSVFGLIVIYFLFAYPTSYATIKLILIQRGAVGTNDELAYI